MKLIHLKSKFVVAESTSSQLIIYDRMLAQEMAIRGIPIPPPLRSEFNGKASVRVSDEEFLRAFKQIYCPRAFPPKSYRWEDSNQRITSASEV